jgi:simple sugar transport system ATP-binding protein
MKKLKDKGTSIVFITHKLREVKEAADKITIIRRGKVVGTASPTASQEELASLMVGRPVSLDVDKNPAKLGNVTLSVSNLTISDHTGRSLVKNVSFEVRAGEILAVAGVQGNGQSELAESIVGLQEHVTGTITLEANTSQNPLSGIRSMQESPLCPKAVKKMASLAPLVLKRI